MTGLTVTPGGTLVVQPLPGIGDMVWHLPHLHALAAQSPGGRVCVLTKPRSQAQRLLRGDASVERVLWLERGQGRHEGVAGLLRLAALLRRQRFATVWILHGSARYALCAWLAGISRRIGYGVGAQRLWLSHPVVLPNWAHAAHPIEKADLLLKLCGVPRTEAEPMLPVSPEARAAVLARFGALPRPWIALGIGSSEPYKQWGGARFIELARALARPVQRTLFVVGGPAERDLGETILARSGAGLAPALDLPLDQTVALLQACRLYVGNDTGVLNMAAAVGVASIGLFGASVPLRHSRHIVAVEPQGGAGMEHIGVDAVLSRSRSLGVE